ncbi:methyltransferase [bacterium]|nr:methyltransferase [bacterium]
MLEIAKHSDLKLTRYPIYPNDKFLAWNAADEYLVNYLNQEYHDLKNILIIEDEFGAIGIHLKADNIYFVNDSILSQKGIISNFNQNKINTSNLSFLSPYDPFPKDIDLIIIKIPKSNSYFEFLISKLNSHYPPDLPLLAATMVKYLNSTLYETCHSLLNNMQYSLTWKKAKIITGKLKGQKNNQDFITKVKHANLTLINYINLFSSSKIDIGTRFLLDNLSLINFPPNLDNIIDLGSGNGIIAFSLLTLLPQAKFWLTDITSSAYHSAKATISYNQLDSNNITLSKDHALDSFPADFADLIITNPPFHENHKVSIAPTLSIFADCFKVLKKNKMLVVIANRHLGYHQHLKKLFSEVNIITQNDKFIILSAIKSI